MSWTKRQLAESAFEEIGLAGYVFDIKEAELQAAVLRLDSLMATWGVVGLRLGYNGTLNPLDADPNQLSGIPDWANEAVFLALCRRIAPSYGKVVSQYTKANAKFAYDAMLNKVMANPPEMQFQHHTPAGAGNRFRRNISPFLPPPVDRLTAGPDSLLEFNGPTS